MNDAAAAEDLELVRGIKTGDDSAFEKMVKRYHARVYSLAYGVLRNPEDAEEATQDAFWTLYRKIGTFDESKKFFSWFYRVALNAAYSRARRRPSLPTTSIEDRMPRFSSDGHFTIDVPDWSVAIEDEAAARELAARAGEIINELPPAYRDVIWMYDVEEMPSSEVAETLEISIPAFKSRLHRARLYVRERLAELQSAKPAERSGAKPAAGAAG
ncbi:MAG TPA: sigma-70 family RNA polymerase sigma factor [Thermoanaerobaculia bacterium]|nr:sigma-70 family RNA polymerase sigma factor [Thermoanaerobaculia bacterium]